MELTLSLLCDGGLAWGMLFAGSFHSSGLILTAQELVEDLSLYKTLNRGTT